MLGRILRWLGAALLLSYLRLHASAEVLTSEGKASIRQLIHNKAGDWPSLKEAYYEAATHMLVGGLQPEYKAALCKAISSKLSMRDGTLEDCFYAVSIAQLAGCTNEKINTYAARQAQAALETQLAAVADAYYAVHLLSGLQHQAQANALNSIALSLASLKTKNGLVAAYADGPTSVTSTGMAYSVLAKLKELTVLPTEHAEAAEEVLSSIPEVLALATSDGLAVAADANPLEATARFLQGAAAVCEREPPVNMSQLVKLGIFLGRVKAVGTAEDAFHLLQAYAALASTGSLPKPVGLTPLTSRLSAAAHGRLEVHASDLLGGPIDTEGLTLRLTLSKGKEAVIDQQAMEAAGKGRFAIALPAKPGLGAYKLAVTASKGEGKVVGSVKSTVVVTDRVQLSAASVEVNRVGSAPGTGGATVVEPGSTWGAPQAVDHTQVLQVSVRVSEASSGRGFAPQQLMLRLRSSASGATVLLAARHVEGASAGSFIFSASANDIARQIGTLGGEFQTTLLAGDIAAEEPIVWELGALKVQHTPLEDGALPSPPGPRAAEALGRIKPEIRHMFREPSRRPPVLVSAAFALLALLPLGVLLELLRRLKVNVKGFPRKSHGATAALAFHGGMAGILGLYALFWLRLTLVTTLTALLPLGGFTWLAGVLALRAHAATRLKQE